MEPRGGRARGARTAADARRAGSDPRRAVARDAKRCVALRRHRSANHRGSRWREDRGGCSDGRSLAADIVIVATGIRPNLDLLSGSGIATRGAIVVNDRMQTNFAHIYAGGDVAEGPVLYGSGNAVHPISPRQSTMGASPEPTWRDRTSAIRDLSMNVIDMCGLQGASLATGANRPPKRRRSTIRPRSFIGSFLWTDDRISGALFIGRADDLGMLTNVGMVKGLMQTQTRLGPWKRYLAEHPFDIRRAYVGSGVAAKLVGTTLIRRRAKARSYRYGGIEPKTPPNAAHAVYVGKS